MVAKSPKKVQLESKNVHFCPKMSTFVHSIGKVHGGFRPLILLAKTMVRRESGQGDQEDMLSIFHVYLRHNQEDRDDFQKKENVHFRQPHTSKINGVTRSL
jgi:hypothetical protein